MFQGQVVTVAAEAREDGLGNRRHKRVMPERFTGMHVGEVHFDHRHFTGHQRVSNRHRGVGPGRRVDHNTGATRAGAVNPVEQFAFVVGLAEFDFQPELFGAATTQGGDIGQGLMAVGGGLAGAEQVEVGAVEHQHDRRHGMYLHSSC